MQSFRRGGRFSDVGVRDSILMGPRPPTPAPPRVQPQAVATPAIARAGCTDPDYTQVDPCSWSRTRRCQSPATHTLGKGVRSSDSRTTRSKSGSLSASESVASFRLKALTEIDHLSHCSLVFTFQRIHLQPKR
jgi:hypothetical protein